MSWEPVSIFIRSHNVSLSLAFFAEKKGRMEPHTAKHHHENVSSLFAFLTWQAGRRGRELFPAVHNPKVKSYMDRVPSNDIGLHSKANIGGRAFSDCAAICLNCVLCVCLAYFSPWRLNSICMSGFTSTSSKLFCKGMFQYANHGQILHREVDFFKTFLQRSSSTQIMVKFFIGKLSFEPLTTSR